eukprot:CAMPEP_0181209872 /NCGR_PEP_ID=MMETSP1096-20121128/22918_1 /TAXON_ID=156174 ORGANISM="Chrysochromulina ericina, Strain CCMP281" /NCGR_SAMPLE_ID=MMETSP1096 /ASSEMBLY_ACC=CAM_ASM_000453 /LENGTH=49 /DNA_ID=CAMNT_0023301103 /DNA_START=317 /DNA_END=469 /DNA_ORIENTATION=-
MTMSSASEEQSRGASYEASTLPTLSHVTGDDTKQPKWNGKPQWRHGPGG